MLLKVRLIGGFRAIVAESADADIRRREPDLAGIEKGAQISEGADGLRLQMLARDDGGKACRIVFTAKGRHRLDPGRVIKRAEEREAVALARRLEHAMAGRDETTVRPGFEHIADIDDESAGNGRRVDP